MNLHEAHIGFSSIPENLQLVIRAYNFHFHYRVRYYAGTGRVHYPTPFSTTQTWDEWDNTAIQNWTDEAIRLNREPPGLLPLTNAMVEILP